jgi:hypothetical protein
VAAGIAGASILLGTISSRIYFENNTEYTGLILLLAGLPPQATRRGSSATRWCCSTPPRP